MTSPSYETILVTRDDRVGTITLNRPKAMNALNSQVMNEVTTAAWRFSLAEEFLRWSPPCRSRTEIYRCAKFGGRFSVNAFMPSVWSSVAKAEWKSRRS